jgi:hypothetical protein
LLPFKPQCMAPFVLLIWETPFFFLNQLYTCLMLVYMISMCMILNALNTMIGKLFTFYNLAVGKIIFIFLRLYSKSSQSCIKSATNECGCIHFLHILQQKFAPTQTSVGRLLKTRQRTFAFDKSKIFIEYLGE